LEDQVLPMFSLALWQLGLSYSQPLFASLNYPLRGPCLPLTNNSNSVLGSEDYVRTGRFLIYVLFQLDLSLIDPVCATLRELSENNTNSWFRNSDPTANCVLQVLLNKDDKQLWNEMDQATFGVIEAMAGEGNGVVAPTTTQRWRSASASRCLEGETKDTIRMPSIVNETSLIPLGRK
jgi:hypothetical protein